MRNILVTGGTVFVSRYVAEYFVKSGDNVYVLNRGTRPQVEGVTLLQEDRHHLGDLLKPYSFDAVLDVTAYTKEDVADLLEGLGQFEQYVLISSSAVYPETLPQPFTEEMPCGANSIWGDYGTNKIEAEQYLLANVPKSYILRPPYLYGPMQNLYREPFVFDCADADRTFYVPKDGSMPLQFFHVEDLCRFIDILLTKKPNTHVFNVGNPEPVDINTWVRLCYQAAGKEARLCYVPEEKTAESPGGIREYFCFRDYGYVLDVKKQQEWMPKNKSLLEGLRESYEWYQKNRETIGKKPYIQYIEKNL